MTKQRYSYEVTGLCRWWCCPCARRLNLIGAPDQQRSCFLCGTRVVFPLYKGPTSDDARPLTRARGLDNSGGYCTARKDGKRAELSSSCVQVILGKRSGEGGRGRIACSVMPDLSYEKWWDVEKLHLIHHIVRTTSSCCKDKMDGTARDEKVSSY